MILNHSLTDQRVLVHATSSASAKVFGERVSRVLQAEGWDQYFFVCHALHADVLELPANVSVLTGKRLAIKAIDAGLLTWLRDTVQ